MTDLMGVMVMGERVVGWDGCGFIWGHVDGHQVEYGRLGYIIQEDGTGERVWVDWQRARRVVAVPGLN